MTNMLFKFEIDAPATADKVKSLLLALDRSKGSMFRIERCWISFPNRDAVATTDKLAFQISLQSQNENADVLEIDSEYEIYTWHRKETFTQDDRGLQPDPTQVIELSDIGGTLLEVNKKNYLNALCTGQDAADVACKVKILGQYVSTRVDDWNYNIL